jgi:hypothetical protein
MIKSLRIFFIVCCISVGANYPGMASTISMTAGDVDWAADRDSYDQGTNMDYFVFRSNSGVNHTTPYSNDLAQISWSYDLTQYLGTIKSASISIYTFDVDPADLVDIRVKTGNTWTTLGQLLNLTSGNYIGYNEYINAIETNGDAKLVNGIDYWTTTTFILSSTLIDLINNSGGNLLFLARNDETSIYNWGVAIDYATLTITSTPEPATLFLLGTGITCLIGIGRGRRKIRL